MTRVGLWESWTRGGPNRWFGGGWTVFFFFGGGGGGGGGGGEGDRGGQTIKTDRPSHLEIVFSNAQKRSSRKLT